MALLPEKKSSSPKPYGYLLHNGLISAIYTEADYLKLLEKGWEASSKELFELQHKESKNKRPRSVREYRQKPRHGNT